MSEHIFEQYSSQLKPFVVNPLEFFEKCQQSHLDNAVKTKVYLGSTYNFTKTGLIKHNSLSEKYSPVCDNFILHKTEIFIFWDYRDHNEIYYGKHVSSQYGFTGLKLLSLLNELGIEIETALNKTTPGWDLNNTLSNKAYYGLDLYTDENGNVAVMCGTF